MAGLREMTAARLRLGTEPGLQACFPWLKWGFRRVSEAPLVTFWSHRSALLLSQRPPQPRVEARCRFLLHVGQHVAVSVDRDYHAAVTQPFADDLWVECPSCLAQGRGPACGDWPLMNEIEDATRRRCRRCNWEEGEEVGGGTVQDPPPRKRRCVCPSRLSAGCPGSLQH